MLENEQTKFEEENIYKKLQSVRVELAAEGLQKSGVNSYSNYKYFELANFVPQMNRLCQKHKLGHFTTFSEDMKQMILTIFDVEKPESTIVFKIPASSATLKASHPIQNLGAVITYSRRYLYMMAFDIVQADVLEAINGKEGTVSKKNKNQTKTFTWDHFNSSEEEFKKFWKFVNWNPDEIADYVEKRSKSLNMQVNSLFYEKVLKELIDYVKNEAANGNSVYAQYEFEEISNTPF